MLKPHGNRPFKAMYRRPLDVGAGLTTIPSTEDEQRLLDHLLAMRQRELAGTEVSESTAFLSSQAPSWNDSTSTSQEPMDTGVGRTGEGSMGSFWTIDDAKES